MLCWLNGLNTPLCLTVCLPHSLQNIGERRILHLKGSSLHTGWCASAAHLISTIHPSNKQLPCCLECAGVQESSGLLVLWCKALASWAPPCVEPAGRSGVAGARTVHVGCCPRCVLEKGSLATMKREALQQFRCLRVWSQPVGCACLWSSPEKEFIVTEWWLGEGDYVLRPTRDLSLEKRRTTSESRFGFIPSRGTVEHQCGKPPEAGMGM